MIRLCAFADESSPTLEGQIDALKRNNISLIELRTIDDKNVFDLTKKEAKKISKTLIKNGIKVWSLGSPVGKVDIDTDFKQYTKKFIRLLKNAKIFGTDKIRMFSFFNAKNKPEKVYEKLSILVKIASKYNIELYHENEKGIFGDTVESVIKLLDNVKGLKSVYDPANFIQCGEDSLYSLQALHAKADYFHIKDVIKETDQLVPAGEGDGNIAKLINDIKGDSVLTLEPHLAVFDAFKQVDNTEMKHKFKFTSNVEAFAFAVKSLKELLVKNGYREINGEFVK